MELTPDLLRGFVIGCAMMFFIVIVAKVLVHYDVLETVRAYFWLKRARRRDLLKAVDWAAVLEKRNAALERAVRDQTSMISGLEESISSRDHFLALHAYMVENLNQYCEKYGDAPKGQYLVAAKTYAENKMREDAEEAERLYSVAAGEEKTDDNP